MTKELGGPDDDRPPVTSPTLGVAARGDVMFVGNWHQIYSYRVVPNRVAPSLALPEEILPLADPVVSAFRRNLRRSSRLRIL